MSRVAARPREGRAKQGPEEAQPANRDHPLLPGGGEGVENVVFQRRRFLQLAGGALLLPLAACGQRGNWPEGMLEIKWDRDPCTRCGMVISDPRFAAQLRGGPKNQAMSFDDIGCLVIWLRDQAAKYPWMNEAATRLWVADAQSLGDQWLDPRNAQFLPGRLSPMGYNYAAIGQAVAASVSFEDLRREVLAREK